MPLAKRKKKSNTSARFSCALFFPSRRSGRHPKPPRALSLPATPDSHKSPSAPHTLSHSRSRPQRPKKKQEGVFLRERKRGKTGSASHGDPRARENKRKDNTPQTHTRKGIRIPRLPPSLAHPWGWERRVRERAQTAAACPVAARCTR